MDTASLQLVKDESLSAPMTVVGMVNGMIGGLILILPVLALNAGYILTLIVILVTGTLSFYSCYLCIIHMGDQPDLDYAILRHFNGNRAVKITYDLCVWLNLILIDMLYFDLIVIQWNGLVNSDTIIIPLVNTAILFILVFVLKYFEFGASIMAYGIISIVAYLLFLIWVIITSDQGNNSVQYKAFGTGSIGMAAAMGQAFSIQSFFIPVLKKNSNPQKYVFYTMLAYIIGGLAYYDIAYMGSFGILHRTYQASKSAQITIEGYFGTGAWQVKIIQAIYLVHLYSVFPQFMLISKKRLFGVLRIDQSHAGHVNIPQVIYIVIAIAICLAINLVQVSIDDIIDINGAVIGFFFIYFLPAVLHVKCLYFSRGKILLSAFQVKQGEQANNSIDIEVQTTKTTKTQNHNRVASETEIQAPLLRTPTKQEDQAGQQIPTSPDAWKYSKATVPVKQAQQITTIHLNPVDIQNSFFYCSCDITQYTETQRILDLIAMGIMVLLGAFIMVNGIYQVAD